KGTDQGRSLQPRIGQRDERARSIRHRQEKLMPEVQFYLMPMPIHVCPSWLRAKRFRLLQLLLLSNLASGQSISIHQQIQQTYNFQPHALTSAEITQKSGVLDHFWSQAKSQRNVYIPALRQELADFHNPPFFLYDGSMLLMSLSNTSEDRKLILAAVAHCDLRDVQPKDYFFQVHQMATLNEDTTVAALHILEQPDFQVFIPQHVLTLGQNSVLVYMLLPTNQDY